MVRRKYLADVGDTASRAGAVVTERVRTITESAEANAAAARRDAWEEADSMRRHASEAASRVLDRIDGVEDQLTGLVAGLKREAGKVAAGGHDIGRGRYLPANAEAPTSADGETAAPDRLEEDEEQPPEAQPEAPRAEAEVAEPELAAEPEAVEADAVEADVVEEHEAVEADIAERDAVEGPEPVEASISDEVEEAEPRVQAAEAVGPEAVDKPWPEAVDKPWPEAVDKPWPEDVTVAEPDPAEGPKPMEADVGEEVEEAEPRVQAAEAVGPEAVRGPGPPDVTVAETDAVEGPGPMEANVGDEVEEAGPVEADVGEFPTVEETQPVEADVGEFPTVEETQPVGADVGEFPTVEETEPVEADVGESATVKQGFFGRLRRGGLRRLKSQPPECAACARPMVGSLTELTSEGWEIYSHAALCPACQSQGWVLSSDAQLPHRRP